MDGFRSSSNLRFPHSRSQAFMDCSMSTSNNYYHHLFHIRQIFQLSNKIQVFVKLQLDHLLH